MNLLPTVVIKPHHGLSQWSSQCIAAAFLLRSACLIWFSSSHHHSAAGHDNLILWIVCNLKFHLAICVSPSMYEWLHLVIHIDPSYCHSSVTLDLPTLYLRISKLLNISYWLRRMIAWFHAPVLFRERNGRDWYFNCNFPIKIKKWEKTIQISVPRKTLCSCPPYD